MLMYLLRHETKDVLIREYEHEQITPLLTEDSPVVDRHDIANNLVGSHLALLQKTIKRGKILLKFPAGGFVLLASVDVDQKALQIVTRLVEMTLVLLAVDDDFDHTSFPDGLLLTTAGLLLCSHGDG